MSGDIAFLFLGETLLVPHLYPLVAATAAAAPETAIDLWLSTSVHETLIARWVAELPANRIRLRRAPGFRRLPDHRDGDNPPLPTKLSMLARLAPALARTPVVVCAEQTSLWLPALLPLRTRFVKVPHGAGSMMERDDRRRRAAWRTLVPAEREREALAAAGVAVERIAVTGYAKAEFRHRTPAARLFSEPRPIVLYNPHWQQHRSSWWRWGAETVRRIVASGRYNLIFAPHQRLVERAPEVATLAAELAGRPDVHCDYQSFAAVDGSYTAAADIYLGDTSSQVVEFLMRPRACVFLDAQGVQWQGDPAYDMWANGEVVTDLAALLPALERAPARQPALATAQARFAEALLGPLDGRSAERGAAEILAARR